MQKQNFTEARVLLMSLLEDNEDDWSLYYMIGQCSSLLKDYRDALKNLKRSVTLNKKEPQVWLALGIAYQNSSLPEDAVKAFVQAIKIDKNYSLAYNSLAYTQFKYLGNLEYALHNYEEAINAHSRCIVKKMDNHSSSPILKTLSTRSFLWLDYAMRSAMYLCALEGIRDIFLPTGEQAEKEERLETHGGLYWINKERDNSRMFLPNYFNTFREALRQEQRYYLMIYNIAEVHEKLGNKQEAESHLLESQVFAP